ncbi:MAG: hypothetical protein R3B45_10670 [Bdellovibrionota bacterium]
MFDLLTHTNNALFFYIVFFVLALLPLFLISCKAYRKFDGLYKSYKVGLALWCQLLPILGFLLYMGVLALNLIFTRLNFLELNSFLSMPEIMILFLAGPLFLTKAGNLIGISTLVYIVEKSFGTHTNFNIGVTILVCSVTIIATLADKMPWHQKHYYGSQAQKIRELFIIALGIIAIAIMFYSFLNMRFLSFWINKIFSLHLAKKTIFIGLSVMFIGWTGVILGASRHILVLLLCLPTCLTFSFISGWPASMTAIPFTGLICLALSNADSQLNLQRRNVAYI